MAWNIRTARNTTPDLEILVNQVNVDVAASIVLDASAVTPDPTTGELKLVAGTPLKKVGNQYVPWDAAADAAGLCLGILARSEVFPDGTAQSDLPSAMWHHGQWFRTDRIVGWATGGTKIRQALPTCKFT
jgi:hypothetical protein